jgi:serine/threonine protein kinase
MSSRLEELLLRWEEQRRNGHPVSADELCRNCPELRDELRAQIAALEQMDHALNLDSNGEAGRETTRGRTRYDDLRPNKEAVPGYRLVARLGKGGFGEVWKANGPGGFAVALKFVSLTGQLGASELRSLEVVKALHHPNLLAVFGAWQVQGFLVIAMELADKTLLDRLHEATAQGQAGIPHDELLRYMEDAAKGIDYLNLPDKKLSDSTKEAIQHRDIKPQNIFVMGGGVKIGDFGLLRILKKTVTEHTGSLTLSYAAPEFFMGHTSRHSDQYSLAVTYCHLRGGRLPFSGHAGQIMQGHLKGTPDLTMLPEGERAVVARALAKDPSDRWPDCRTFAGELFRAAPTLTRPEFVAPTVRQFSALIAGRSRAYLWLGAILLLALGVLAAWQTLHRDDRPSPGPALTTSYESEPDEPPPDVVKVPASGSKEAKAACEEGLRLFDAHDNSKAIAAFTKAIQHDPKCALAFVYRGWVNAREHQPDATLADANQAIQLLSEDNTDLLGLAYLVRGHGCRHKGNPDKAIADYTTALRFKPDWSAAYYWRGVAYAQKGDTKRAKADKDKAAKLGSKSGRE